MELGRRLLINLSPGEPKKYKIPSCRKQLRISWGGGERERRQTRSSFINATAIKFQRAMPWSGCSFVVSCFASISMIYSSLVLSAQKYPTTTAPQKIKKRRTDGRTAPFLSYWSGAAAFLYISFHVSGTNKRNNNQMLSVYTISIMDAIFARAGKYLPSQTNNSVPARGKKKNRKFSTAPFFPQKK